MFVEIKPLSAIDQLSARADAELQMRRRFIDFHHATPSIFTGISAFGHMLCVYEVHEGDNRITPPPIQGSSEYVVDFAPRVRWDLDLTTAPGAARILAVFQGVKDVMLNEAA